MTTDRCPDCHAETRPIITHTGRRIDLETTKHEDGRYRVITGDDGAVRAAVVGELEMPAADAYRLHRCPPDPEPGPNCFHCGRPMPRAIATQLKWTEHPACSPEFIDQIRTEYQIARARQFRQGKKGRRK